MSCSDAVLSYMRQQNRPFGVTNVTDALQSVGFKKAQVQSALTSLAEKGELLVRAHGSGAQEAQTAHLCMQAIANKTSTVYLVTQPEEAASPAEVRALEQGNAQLDAQVKSLRAQLASLKGGASPSRRQAASSLPSGLRDRRTRGRCQSSLPSFPPSARRSLLPQSSAAWAPARRCPRWPQQRRR